MKFCMKCGEKLLDDSTFCPKCGHEQPDLGEKKREISLVQTPRQMETSRKKTKHINENITDAIGCIIIIIGIVVLIILYAFFEDWLAILWPYIVGFIVISWILRLVGAGIVELFKRSIK